jgi:hypothetical protein
MVWRAAKRRVTDGAVGDEMRTIPNAVMPNATAAMGRSISIAALLPLTRSCQVSSSPAAHARVTLYPPELRQFVDVSTIATTVCS